MSLRKKSKGLIVAWSLDVIYIKNPLLSWCMSLVMESGCNTAFSHVLIKITCCYSFLKGSHEQFCRGSLCQYIYPNSTHAVPVFYGIIATEAFLGTCKLAINNEIQRVVLLHVKLYQGDLLKIEFVIMYHNALCDLEFLILVTLIFFEKQSLWLFLCMCVV